jgi:recombination protein RecA
MYGEGISKMGELIDMGVAAGIVEKSGAWFSYGEQRIGQGRENAKQFLRDNPDISNEIENSIRESAGLLATKMEITSAKDDDEDDAPDDKSAAKPDVKPGAEAETG